MAKVLHVAAFQFPSFMLGYILVLDMLLYATNSPINPLTTNDAFGVI